MWLFYVNEPRSFLHVVKIEWNMMQATHTHTHTQS